MDIKRKSYKVKHSDNNYSIVLEVSCGNIVAKRMLTLDGIKNCKFDLYLDTLNQLEDGVSRIYRLRNSNHH